MSLTDEEILDFVRDNLIIDKDENGSYTLKEVNCDVEGHVYGDVKGDVCGDVRGNVIWDVYGKVLGKVHGDGNKG